VSEGPTALRAPWAGALGTALVAVGLGFDSPAALIPGIALIALALTAVTWVELASRGGRLQRDPGPRTLVEGGAYPLRIRLSRTLVRPPGGALFDSMLRRPLAVGPRWPRRIDQRLHPRGPGRRRLGDSRLIVQDPLGLWTRELRCPGPGDLVVLPRIEPVRPVEPAGDALGFDGGRRSSRGRGSTPVEQPEVDGLRPYRPGSPASRIHWPAVARSGEMMERRLVAGEGSRPLVVLDLRGAEGGRDRAMRAAASLCFELARGGGCELLLPGARRALPVDPQLRSWPEAHLRLALATPGPISPALARRSCPVIWVAASSRRPPGGLPAGSFLVGPRRPVGPIAFRVAGCFGRAASGRRAGTVAAAA
jgi:uncharacterized protein (DUF58 family)